MRDGKEEWKHRHPAGRLKVSPVFCALFHWEMLLIALRGWPFLYYFFHPVNVHPLGAVVF